MRLPSLGAVVVATLTLACASPTLPDGQPASVPSAATQPVVPAPGLSASGPRRLVGDRSLVSGHPPRSESGLLNVVVEIPAGTNGKWEVEKSSGELVWELRDGKPRQVDYLGYPGNYGMVPRTLLPKQLGGDGDPLDVIVLGPAVARGSVVETRLIGVLKLLDRGEQDHKLVAVMLDSPLGQVESLAQLDREFVGVTNILETWFSHYKGPDEMVSQGFGDRREAEAILEQAIAAFPR